MSQKSNRQIITKHYAQGVIFELQKLGYPYEEANEAFFRHYRELKRAFGLEPNVTDFALLVDEFERAMKGK